MSKRNICVVGAGYWGKNHIRALNDLDCLGGIVEPDRELLLKFSEEYPGVKIYESLNDALSNATFNGFTVATPAETHYNIAVQIIKAKKNVLVEKPLCLNTKDARELINLSEKYNVSLMVGHLLLFHPAIIKIKQIISENLIGDLQYIYSNRLNLGQVRREENAFWSLAPHDISIFQYLTESYPVTIRANGSSFLQEGIHDSTITHLCYPNGIEGHIFVSWLHPFKEHRLVVIGSEAMIVFEDSSEDKPLKLFSKKFDLNFKIPRKIDGPIEFIDYEKKLPLTEELKYFTKEMDKKKIAIADGKHGLEVLKILTRASKELKE